MYCARRLEFFAGPAGIFRMTSWITADILSLVNTRHAGSQVFLYPKSPDGIKLEATRADDARHCTSIAPLTTAIAPLSTAVAPAKTARESRRDFPEDILDPLVRIPEGKGFDRPVIRIPSRIPEKSRQDFLPYITKPWSKSCICLTASVG